MQIGNLAVTSIAYDAHGRVASVTVGSGSTARTRTVAYDATGQPSVLVDELSRSFGFQYDLAGSNHAEGPREGSEFLPFSLELRPDSVLRNSFSPGT